MGVGVAANLQDGHKKYVAAPADGGKYVHELFWLG
jgi:hypothetical protein